MVFNLVQECFWSFVKQTTFKEWKFEMRTIWWPNFPRSVRIVRVTQRSLCFLGSKFYPLASAMHSTLLFWGLKLQRRLSWVTKRIGTQSFDSKNGILALLSESWKKLRFQKNLQSRFVIPAWLYLIHRMSFDDCPPKLQVTSICNIGRHLDLLRKNIETVQSTFKKTKRFPFPLQPMLPPWTCFFWGYSIHPCA